MREENPIADAGIGGRTEVSSGPEPRLEPAVIEQG